MKYLAYCICLKKKSRRINAPALGVGARPTYLVAGNDLAAVVSVMADNDLPRDSATILEYHNAIESLHNQIGVVPLRFGTVIDREEEVIHLLEKHGERYKKLLKELDGCVEMGIRVISEDVSINPEPWDNAYARSVTGCPGAGAAYLAERKSRYDAETVASEKEQDAIARHRSPFDGLIVNFKGQASKLPILGSQPRATLLSLDFLVSRRSVDSFRAVYNRLKPEENAKMMLSGPWPPYSFVLPEDY